MKNNKNENKYLSGYYERNYNWEKKDIANLYQLENPTWSLEECWLKSCEVYREMKNLNAKQWRDNGKYYKMCKPFSFYESEDGTWSSVTTLNEV